MPDEQVEDAADESNGAVRRLLRKLPPLTPDGVGRFDEVGVALTEEDILLLALDFVVAAAFAVDVTLLLVFLCSFVLYSSHLSFSIRVLLKDLLLRLMLLLLWEWGDVEE